MPLSTILIAASMFGALFLGIGFLVLKTLKLRKDKGASEFEGREARVSSIDGNGQSGFVEIQGELWMFESGTRVEVGDLVQVVKTEGLKLIIKSKGA